MSFMDKKCAVILAAGEGTRMKSKKPKALAEVLFAPMIDWVIGAVKESGIDDICVVKGFGAEYLDARPCSRARDSERVTPFCRRETLLKATAAMSSF